MLDKKGMDKGLLVFLIILALSLVVLTPFLIKFEKGVEGFADDETCRQSAIANAQRIKFKGTEITGPKVELNCPTKKINILSSDKSGEKDEINIYINSKDESKEAVAKELYSCWSKLGYGKLKLFEEKDKNFCLVCSQLKFGINPSKTKEWGGDEKKLEGFTKFLGETETPFGSKTYFKALTGYETEKGKLENVQNIQDFNKQDSIDISSDYAIIYFMGKDANLGKLKGTGIGVVVGSITVVAIFGTGGLAAIPLGLGAVAGGVLGYGFSSEVSANWWANVLLIPYENVKEVKCDVLK